MDIAKRTRDEINIMSKAGQILASIVSELYDAAVPGMTTKDLDSLGDKLCKMYEVQPAFKNYRGFPASLCISINEEVVHGIPSERIIEKGDVVSMDFGVKYKGYYADMAVTKLINSCDTLLEKLVRVTKDVLYKAIEVCRPGNNLNEISQTIEKYVKANGFSVVKALVGHGIGKKLHEPPQIPNYFESWMPSLVLQKGMVLAVEPMVNLGRSEIKIKDDNWTVVTKDGKYSAHFEHTVLVDDEPRILTLNNRKVND